MQVFRRNLKLQYENMATYFSFKIQFILCMIFFYNYMELSLINIKNVMIHLFFIPWMVNLKNVLMVQKFQ